MKATAEQLKCESARRAARAAIRSGRILPTPCVRCGEGKKVVAHHDDYDRPLDVMFLCELCHKARHRELGWGHVPHAVKRSRGTNLHLPKSLIEITKQYAASDRRIRNVSRLTEMLLVAHLKKKGVKLPLELTAD